MNRVYILYAFPLKTGDIVNAWNPPLLCTTLRSTVTDLSSGKAGWLEKNPLNNKLYFYSFFHPCQGSQSTLFQWPVTLLCKQPTVTLERTGMRSLHAFLFLSAVMHTVCSQQHRAPSYFQVAEAKQVWAWLLIFMWDLLGKLLLEVVLICQRGRSSLWSNA